MSAPSPFAPLPPPHGGSHTSAFSLAVVAIIPVLGSAFLVVSYYRIMARLCTRWQIRRAEADVENQFNSGGDTDATASPMLPHGLDEALINKISIFGYKKYDAFTAETECSVCLMEFADNQELRLLPKCAHAFHLTCIDTWLSTHSTCPLCRASIFSEQVMNQYHRPMAPSPQMSFFSTPENGGGLFSPVDYPMAWHNRSPAPTLRGLLNYEDNLQQHPPPIFWVPPGSESGRAEPGEDSIRLYNSRDYGDDFSARDHVTSTGIVPPNTNPGPQDLGADAPSFNEIQRSQSRDRERKCHISSRRWSSRIPFASVRSFSMGTSRRLASALEFLDLEGLRSHGHSKGAVEKILFSPYEYGITETPDYHHQTGAADFASLATATTEDPEIETAGMAAAGVAAAGPSSQVTEPLRSPSVRWSDAGELADSSGPSIKNSGRVKGRSLSFRSPFSFKTSYSSGTRGNFSLRNAGKINRIFSPSPPTPSPDSSVQVGQLHGWLI